MPLHSVLGAARFVRVVAVFLRAGSSLRGRGTVGDAVPQAARAASRSIFPALVASHNFCSGSMAGKGGRMDLSQPGLSWREARAYLKGLSSKQRPEHYSMKDFIRLKQIPTWKDTAKSAKLKPLEEVKYKKDKHLIEKISLFKGDITKLEVDAIVNTVDGCIHRAAGPLLKEECSTLNGCEIGKAKLTCGYSLPAKYVIHTVGPAAQGDPSQSQEGELVNCYKNSLRLVLENKLRTVAFPCISTGVFGYPNDAAADVALNTIRPWLEENKDKVDRIIICVFLEKDEEIYLKKLPEYFPTGFPVVLRSHL